VSDITSALPGIQPGLSPTQVTRTARAHSLPFGQLKRSNAEVPPANLARIVTAQQAKCMRRESFWIADVLETFNRVEGARSAGRL